MTKLKEEGWFQKPRSSRLASVLWPHLTSPETRKQMEEIARGEGKRPPQGPNLLPHVPWDAQLKKGK
jgi:hypothetical protein